MTEEFLIQGDITCSCCGKLFHDIINYHCFKCPDCNEDKYLCDECLKSKGSYCPSCGKLLHDGGDCFGKSRTYPKSQVAQPRQNSTTCCIKLNDLLQLSAGDIKRTKIRLNARSQGINAIDEFKKNPAILDGWNFWNNQSYKVGQISIGLAKISEDKWLLFTIATIDSIIDIPKGTGIGCTFTPIQKYKQYFGRVIVKYKNLKQNMFRNAKSCIDDLEVSEIIPDVYTGFDFPGYDKVSLSYSELAAIVNGNYPSYKNALQNQKAVYLQTDKKTGKLYVGSATSSNGMLLDRWKDYVKNGHGGNKGLKQLIEDKGLEYIKENFQYTIIENFDSKVDDQYILSRESYWKNVLCSRQFGYNNN